jgi:hypothetical protein
VAGHIKIILDGIDRYVSGHKNFPWPSVEFLRQLVYGAQGQGPKPKQKPSWGFSGYLEVLPEEEPSPVPSPESRTKEP